ncbi:hypothetical protein N566_23380, partial [Streptomycetaceae bacterium MP113-05]
MTTALALAAAALLGGALPAVADEKPAAPTEAGTSFRSATVLEPGQRARADASTGDYLYWAFAAGAGRRPTARATVRFPDSGTRSGSVTWRLDVYDGLRRHQPCVAGRPERTAVADAASLDLRCTLRAVQPWAQRWANDPLAGAFYVRLTAVDAAGKDLGLPVRTEIRVTDAAVSGARRGGGEIAEPVLPPLAAGAKPETGDASPSDTGDAPDEDPLRRVAVSEP